MATRKTAASKPQPKVASTKKPRANAKTSASSTSNTNEKNAKKPNSKKQPRSTKRKMCFVALIFVAVILLAAVITAIVLLITHQVDTDKAKRAEYTEPVYSILTGEELASTELNSSPSYCVQIPNGSTDGARPQAGLNQAGVVFEAIAERGITRFAAVFQNANTGVIGPIRSLRSYYLDWDTPFDCTIVHAGGSDEALADLNIGGQRNLDESYEYMWREDSDRAWNNLFTSPAEISRFNSENGYTTSSIKAFPRYTPDENDDIVAELQACVATDDENNNSTEDSEAAEACTSNDDLTTDIEIGFGSIPMYNTVYHYDIETNSYLRSYANGEAHLVYNCPSDLEQPNTRTACGNPIQIAPRAVVAMFVQENSASDGYHEEINTISSGSALVFQNGEVIEATWSKTAQDSQIVFRNSSNEEIKFAPGQLWIAAVPQYGSVNY